MAYRIAFVCHVHEAVVRRRRLEQLAWSAVLQRFRSADMTAQDLRRAGGPCRCRFMGSPVAGTWP
jgi:hypothetical protein